MEENNEPLIKKISNNPAGEILLAKDQKGNYFSMIKEKLGETKLSKK